MKRLLILSLLISSPSLAARNFDGANDEITFGNNYNVTTGDFSAAVWIKPTEDADADWWLVKKDGFANSQAGYGIGTGSGDALATRIADGVDGAQCNGTNDLDGLWTHVAITWNGTSKTLTLYENGVVICSSVSAAVGSISNTAHLQTGESNTDGEDANGLAAFAEVWVGKVLSEAEVLQTMRQPGSVPALTQTDKGFWPIWGVHSPEIDLSGNGRTGTIVAGTTLSTDGPPVMFGSVQ